MEETLMKGAIMRWFTGIEKFSDLIRDQTVILTLGHLPVKHMLSKKVFKTVKVHVGTRGMTMRQDTIVDALDRGSHLRQEQRGGARY